MSGQHEKDLRAEGLDQLEQLVSEFEQEQADLLEAMRTFGISNAEYERAVRALYGSVISTSSSSA